MTYQTFIAAAAALAGTVGLAAGADAQVIYRGGAYHSSPGTVYSSSTTPNVVYSSYSTSTPGVTYASPGVTYSSYSTPTYSYSTPTSGSGMILSNGYMYPTYTSGYLGNTYYTSPYTTGYYGNSRFYSPYSNGYYGGYNNLYNGGLYGVGIGSRGLSFGGRRIGRW